MKGRKEGRKEGRKKGRKEGRKEGRKGRGRVHTRYKVHRLREQRIYRRARAITCIANLSVRSDISGSERYRNARKSLNPHLD